MSYMKSTHMIQSGEGMDVWGGVTDGETWIFSDSQFFPALDGTQIMVDWIPGAERWYVTTQDA